MPWWVTLIIELVKLLWPIISSIKSDEKPNKEATKEVVRKIRDVVGAAPEIKKV